jgi:hypothetical protein
LKSLTRYLKKDLGSPLGRTHLPRIAANSLASLSFDVNIAQFTHKI